MEIKIIKSDRKTLSLSVDDELNAVVRAPFFTADKVITDFINSNQQWLEKAIEHKKIQLAKYNLPEEEILRLTALAKEYIPARVKYYSQLMKLNPSSVKITRAKKRFGSCSSRNSLCFSCFLMAYPASAVDYVIVHELAHIKHHNHGIEFYALIAEYMPDYKQREKLLKT